MGTQLRKLILLLTILTAPVMLVGQRLNSAATVVRTEIVLCLDVSGSIDNTELGLEIDGLKACLNKTSNIPQDGSVAVAIVVYGATAANALGTLTPITAASLAGTIEPALMGLLSDRIVSPSETNIRQGLINSRNILTGGMLAGGISNDQFILLVGDGRSNPATDIQPECQNIANADIIICAIGVGDDPAEFDELQDCAEATGGEFSIATTFNRFLPVCERCIEVILPLVCKVNITSPQNGVLICDDKVVIKGVVTITGGLGPFTIVCSVRNTTIGVTVPASEANNMFTATVPCSPGTNILVASCTVTDTTGEAEVCRAVLRVVCAAPPVCKVNITSPQDSAIICNDKVKVTATLDISGGIPPFTTTCEINGVAAVVNGNMFMATVPLAPGWNDLIASCRVKDSCGKTTDCRDIKRVFSVIDKIPPTCTFVGGYKSVTGTFFDNESGIAKIEPLFLFNATLTVENFTPGAKKVNFRLDDKGEQPYLGFDIKITDRCGNMHVCDPVLSYLSADRENRQYTLNFRRVDRYLILTNHGLSVVRVDLNGHQFALYSESNRGARTLNAYRIPTEGSMTIDLQPYLQEGENTIRLEIEGRAGTGADLLLIDKAHEIDHTLELQSIPTEFLLSQNYPNPFNPTTTIHFGIPARMAEGTQTQLRIYNTLGALVRILVDEKMFPGQYTVAWDGKNAHSEDVASGIYIYQLVAGEFKTAKRMTIVK